MAAGTQVALGLVGPGLIGRTMLAQLADQAGALRHRYSANVAVMGVCNSQRMLLGQQLLRARAELPGDWRQALEAQGQPVDLSAFGQHIVASGAPCSVIVDCTAGEAAPDHYAAWMRQGLHVITANKKMGAGPLGRLLDLKQIQAESAKHFYYEASVGAGLPIISTLRTLLDTGDEVTRIEGVLSGTLSFIFNNFGPGKQFSSVVAEAKALGYTEPDPREDLSGTDVARKVIILARECGLKLELDTLDVTSLVPEELQGCSAAEYMERLPEFDEGMTAAAADAAAAGEVVRYVGVVDVAAGTASVSLARYPKSHPFAQLAGSDNMVSFTTQRYPAAQPLIVRGPGAGAEVTAGGVFGDLVTLMRCHGTLPPGL